MRPLDRREFLFDTARFTAALAAAGLLRPAELTAADQPATRGSANDRLRVAVIGIRSRGVEHVGNGSKEGWLRKGNNCEIATICDVDEGVIEKGMKAAESVQGKRPKYEKDLRHVFDDPSIDVVSIATPNHWHSLAAIWALQAGKHVYVEKPVSHNVSEGRRLVEMSRKMNKLCQAGTQIRSRSGIREAMKFLHDGGLGKVHLARGLCYKTRDSIGHVSGPQQPPKTMDYDLWCGPAPKNPPMRNGKFGPVHYDWHWVWDYGNGDLGNQGIHQMDVARWGLNRPGLPRSIVSLGGRYGYVDDGQTPNTQLCLFDYGGAKLIFEVRGLSSEDLLADQRGKPTGDKKLTARVGNVFYGENGYLVCSSYADAVAMTPDDQVIRVFKSKSDDDHFGNFAAAIRSGSRAGQHGEIEEGHLSSATCHLGNVSYRLGREVPFSSGEAKSCRDTDGTEALGRMRKHLEKNKISLDQAECRIGAELNLDVKTERFLDNAKANALLSREYRKGFEVPAKI
jgi:predicted dehydrogenase